MGLRDYAKLHMNIDVCMLGARGVGKTTVMTAIFNELNEATGLAEVSNIILSAKGDTRRNLSKHYMELQTAFDKKQGLPQAGLQATSGVNKFEFEFGTVGKLPCVDMTLTDYPGEYLQSQQKFVNECIENSSAIMIAIDTPYLMEENGAYNEAKNQVQQITDYIRRNIDLLSSGKLVMLVPLKCEKYFYEQRMCEVIEKVEEKYASLITLLKGRSDVAVAITSILTLGGVVFDKFDTMNNTKIARYKYLNDTAEFEPKFCQQPIYYLLSFVANQYTAHKNSAGWLATIVQKALEFFKHNEDLCGEMFRLNQFRIEDASLGFKIISGEKMLKMK